VAGRGAAKLRAAGIAVDGGLLADEGRALNPGFFKRMQSGWPWVRVKLAQSLDGRTALQNGASRWITGAAARADVQRYRARSSAILTGVGTVLVDNPQLNVRLEGVTRQPLRVVLDTELRVPATARVFTAAGESLVFTASHDDARQRQLSQRQVRVEQVPQGQGGLDLAAVLRRLGQLEINELWVEAGARLSGALLAAGMVDELLLYLAPCLLGPQARPLVELPAITQLDARLQLQLVDLTRIGEDVRITARPLAPGR
jgi:diaminohydroxyphosphoribosylaminopyrimidine deaminase/5-amino-6-(5-phosphoribosylamino)uracil reductase